MPIDTDISNHYQNIIPNKTSAVHLKKFPKVAGQLWIPSSELWVYTLILYILPGLLLVLGAADADDGEVGAHGSLVVGLAVGGADQDVYNPGVRQTKRAKTGQATAQE